MRTMCWTWDFSAPPLPTTASLTDLGLYSCTWTPALSPAQRTAPRAWPSLRAAVGSRAKMSCSTAISWGA